MYQQPSFYHFTEDSIELAKYTADLVKDIKNLTVLDVCAGCGIVGLEFLQAHQSVYQLDFVEKQLEFGKSLNHNINEFAYDIKTDVYIKSCERINFPNSYDLILSNPPYFILGHGREPNDKNKLECEFMTMEDYKSLMIFAKNSLKPGGSFFFLGREDQLVNQEMLKESMIQIEKDLGKTKIFKFIDQA